MSTRNELQIFKRQVLQLVPLKDLAWPDGKQLGRIESQQWLFHNLFDSESVIYLPSSRYRLQVLKELLRRIELSIQDQDQDQDEISDNLTEVLAELLSSPLPPESTTVQQRSYVTYSFPALSEEASITLLESRNVIAASGTTGLRTWEASMHLASLLTTPDGPKLVNNKRVLELGVGSGLVSILCAKCLRPLRFEATDGSQEVVDAFEDNLFLNKLQESHVVKAKVMRWGTAIEAGEDGVTPVFDTVLGADITFDSSLFPSLIYTFREIFGSNPAAEIVISATIRNPETFSKFLNSCEKAMFDVQTIAFEQVDIQMQTGPFYSTNIPIELVIITGSRMGLRDTFAF